MYSWSCFFLFSFFFYKFQGFQSLLRLYILHHLKRLLTFLMSSKQLISGERPPWTQRNCWLRRAARGKQSNASMHASYTRSEYFILPAKTKEGCGRKAPESVTTQRLYKGKSWGAPSLCGIIGTFRDTRQRSALFDEITCGRNKTLLYLQSPQPGLHRTLFISSLHSTSHVVSC